MELHTKFYMGNGMKNFTQGIHQANIYVNTMRINISENLDVVSGAPFIIFVDYYYEEGFPDTEDEPGCPDYFDIRKISLLSPVYLFNSAGVSLIIKEDINMLDIIDESQYDVILEALGKQSGGPTWVNL